MKTVMLLPGLLAPFSIPAAALRKYEVGGDEIVNENVLSVGYQSMNTMLSSQPIHLY